LFYLSFLVVLKGHFAVPCNNWSRLYSISHPSDMAVTHQSSWPDPILSNNFLTILISSLKTAGFSKTLVHKQKTTRLTTERAIHRDSLKSYSAIQLHGPSDSQIWLTACKKLIIIYQLNHCFIWTAFMINCIN
jgi:hypothetical protein